MTQPSAVEISDLEAAELAGQLVLLSVNDTAGIKRVIQAFISQRLSAGLRQDFTPLPKAWCEICHGFNGVPSGPDLWCPRCKHIVATFNIDIEGAPQDVPLVVPPRQLFVGVDDRHGTEGVASSAAKPAETLTDADFDALIEDYGLADAQYEIAWRNLEMPDRERQKFRTTRDQKREALRTAIAQLRVSEAARQQITQETSVRDAEFVAQSGTATRDER